MPSLLPSIGLKESVALTPARDSERAPDGTEAPFAGVMAQYVTPPPQRPQEAEAPSEAPLAVAATGAGQVSAAVPSAPALPATPAAPTAAAAPVLPPTTPLPAVGTTPVPDLASASPLPAAQVEPTPTFSHVQAPLASVDAQAQAASHAPDTKAAQEAPLTTEKQAQPQVQSPSQAPGPAQANPAPTAGMPPPREPAAPVAAEIPSGTQARVERSESKVPANPQTVTTTLKAPSATPSTPVPTPRAEAQPTQVQANLSPSPEAEAALPQIADSKIQAKVAQTARPGIEVGPKGTEPLPLPIPASAPVAAGPQAPTQPLPQALPQALAQVPEAETPARAHPLRSASTPVPASLIPAAPSPTIQAEVQPLTSSGVAAPQGSSPEGAAQALSAPSPEVAPPVETQTPRPKPVALLALDAPRTLGERAPSLLESPRHKPITRLTPGIRPAEIVPVSEEGSAAVAPSQPTLLSVPVALPKASPEVALSLDPVLPLLQGVVESNLLAPATRVPTPVLTQLAAETVAQGPSRPQPRLSESKVTAEPLTPETPLAALPGTVVPVPVKAAPKTLASSREPGEPFRIQAKEKGEAAQAQGSSRPVSEPTTMEPATSTAKPTQGGLQKSEGLTSRADGPTASATPSSPAGFSLPNHPAQPIAPPAPAQALTPATAAAPAHPAAIQVGDSLKWILRQSNPSAELQLHPENLGKVTIQLKVDGTEVHARVWASEASTLPVLQDHRAYLEVSLRQQGLQLGSFDLQQGQRGHQPQAQLPAHQGFGAFREEAASSARQETPTTLASTFASSHRIEVMA